MSNSLDGDCMVDDVGRRLSSGGLRLSISVGYDLGTDQRSRTRRHGKLGRTKSLMTCTTSGIFTHILHDVGAYSLHVGIPQYIVLFQKLVAASLKKLGPKQIVGTSTKAFVHQHVCLISEKLNYTRDHQSLMCFSLALLIYAAHDSLAWIRSLEKGPLRLRRRS